MSVKAALVQTRTPDRQSAALAHVAPLIRRAADAGARLILTPEGVNILERDRERSRARLVLEDEDEAVQGLCALAREYGIELLIGSALLRKDAGGYANRSLLIGPDGAVRARYDKIHMFDVDLPDGQRLRESHAYEAGAAAVTARASGALLGLSICYDIRFPALYRALAKAGAEVLTVPSAFTRKTGEAHWEILIRARAIENGAFVLAPAQGGVHADGRATWGRSLAVAPWGEILGGLDHDEPGILLVDLDLDRATAARRAIPSLANERDFTGPCAPDVEGPEAGR